LAWDGLSCAALAWSRACAFDPAWPRSCAPAWSAPLPLAAWSAFLPSPSPDAPAGSIRATTLPSETVSPTLSLSSRTTPANGAGTSIVALSDSSVTRPWSCATVSPSATSTSITGTSS
jgi:hypothetical protein